MVDPGHTTWAVNNAALEGVVAWVSGDSVESLNQRWAVTLTLLAL